MCCKDTGIRQISRSIDNPLTFCTRGRTCPPRAGALEIAQNCDRHPAIREQSQNQFRHPPLLLAAARRFLFCDAQYAFPDWQPFLRSQYNAWHAETVSRSVKGKPLFKCVGKRQRFGVLIAANILFFPCGRIFRKIPIAGFAPIAPNFAPFGY